MRFLAAQRGAPLLSAATLSSAMASDEEPPKEAAEKAAKETTEKTAEEAPEETAEKAAEERPEETAEEPPKEKEEWQAAAVELREPEPLDTYLLRQAPLGVVPTVVLP